MQVRDVEGNEAQFRTAIHEPVAGDRHKILKPTGGCRCGSVPINMKMGKYGKFVKFAFS